MMNFKQLICFLLLAFLLVNCNKEDIIIPKESTRTVLVYMAADNSLGAGSNSFDKQNIDGMLEGCTEKTLNGGNLIVYVDAKDTIPLLLQITPEGKKELKSYPDHQNSVSVETMQEVMEDVKELFPSPSYGLMLWSHGSNWFPSDMTLLRAFGQDQSNWMELPELKEALPDNGYDFIIFDACYMAGIEVMYELKDKTPYIIAAPTEILGSGFPYSRIIGHLFAKTVDLKKICDEFYDYYANSSNPDATIALVSTAGLENLATTTRAILKDNFDKTENIQFSTLQRYYRPSYYGMYDFDDYILRIAPEEQYVPFQTALNEVVVYKKNTDSFLLGHNGFRINHFSGLSSFVMREAYGAAILQKYKELDWYKAVYQ